MSGLRRGEVAAAAGVNIETLRYYERRGLLREPQRSLGGHRLYRPETITILRLIKVAQRLGFTLDEVADLLAATRLDGRSDGGLHARAAVKLIEVDRKLAELTAVRDILRAALDTGCDDLLLCAESASCPLPFTVDRDENSAHSCDSGRGVTVIELMPESVDNIVGMRFVGKLSTADYRDVLVPRIDSVLERYPSLRVLILVDESFDGWSLSGAWANTVFDMKHRRDFDKIAMVGAPKWEEWCVKAPAAVLMRGKLRTFSRENLDDAWAWVRAIGSAPSSP